MADCKLAAKSSNEGRSLPHASHVRHQAPSNKSLTGMHAPGWMHPPLDMCYVLSVPFAAPDEMRSRCPPAAELTHGVYGPSSGATALLEDLY